MTRLATLASATLLLAACVRPEHQLAHHYEARQHAPYRASGTATIRGEGFIRRANGALVRCSGERVYLVPATPYFDAWVDVYLTGGVVADADGRARLHSPIVRVTQCDSRGRFAFEDLPEGVWHVLAYLDYEEFLLGYSVSSDYGRGFGVINYTMSENMQTKVETRAGKTTRVVLANPNRVD